MHLQAVLGSDLEICPKGIFLSGASSGRPRGWSVFGIPDFRPEHLQERASSRVSERSSVDAIGTAEMEDSGVVIFPDSGFFTSTASGRPRAPPNAVGTFRGRPRVLFLFCREGISGNARMDLGTSSGFGLIPFPETQG